MPQALLSWIQHTLQSINLTVLNFLGVLIEDTGNKGINSASESQMF